MDKTTCEACGMPMTNDSDYPSGNRASAYCVHCGDADGNLTNTYDNVLDYYISDLVESKELTEEAARVEATSFLATLPAWSGPSD